MRSGEKVGGRGGTQLIDFKNKPLCTCTSNACFRSATGTSTCSLVGSSLEPAAGSTSPAASTRPRAVCTWFFAPWGFTYCVSVKMCLLAPVGVFVALCRALWCLCDTLGGLGDPLWHFGFPFWDTWGAVGSLLGTWGGPWDFISAPWNSIWVPLGSMLVSCGHFEVWPWNPWATFVEKP